ncbi:hypothetical protein QL285_091993 [Trifolium repens]|nr:hypothetical protein QL285_091993 [Trifolium repens]
MFSLQCGVANCVLDNVSWNNKVLLVSRFIIANFICISVWKYTQFWGNSDNFAGFSCNHDLNVLIQWT